MGWVRAHWGLVGAGWGGFGVGWGGVGDVGGNGGVDDDIGIDVAIVGGGIVAGEDFVCWWVRIGG